MVVDKACFEFSDIQALKILAAYSIQKDCAIQDVDMFDLMDYCGWYDVNYAQLDQQHMTGKSIHNGGTHVLVVQDIGTVGTNTLITEEIHGLSPPTVPA